jgi:hypothetical protein
MGGRAVERAAAIGFALAIAARAGATPYLETSVPGLGGLFGAEDVLRLGESDQTAANPTPTADDGSARSAARPSSAPLDQAATTIRTLGAAPPVDDQAAGFAAGRTGGYRAVSWTSAGSAAVLTGAGGTYRQSAGRGAQSGTASWSYTAASTADLLTFIPTPAAPFLAATGDVYGQAPAEPPSPTNPATSSPARGQAAWTPATALGTLPDLPSIANSSERDDWGYSSGSPPRAALEGVTAVPAKSSTDFGGCFARASTSEASAIDSLVSALSRLECVVRKVFFDGPSGSPARAL